MAYIEDGSNGALRVMGRHWVKDKTDPYVFAHISGEGEYAWVGLIASGVTSLDSATEGTATESGRSILSMTPKTARDLAHGLLRLIGDPVPVASRGSWDAAFAAADNTEPVDLDWYATDVMPAAYAATGLPVDAYPY